MAVGSPDSKITTTSKADIGRALAELTLLALNPVTAPSVPDDVRIAGDNVSYHDVRDIVQRVRAELGVQHEVEIKLESKDLVTFRESLREEMLVKPRERPADHIK